MSVIARPFLQGNMQIALRLSVAFVLSLCFVKFALTLHVGLCHVMINIEFYIAVISHVVCR